MGKLQGRIKYTCSGYKYAPESFVSFKCIIDRSGRGNHRYERLNLPREQEHEIGYAYITQGRKAAADLAKRYDRARSKTTKFFVTYGFFSAGSDRTYHFTRDLYCLPDAPIAKRFDIYKRFKEQLLAVGCKVEQSTQCELDGDYQPVNVMINYETVDITRPIIVRLRAV